MTEIRTIADRLKEMRDDMLTLVTAYNSIHRFDEAMEAQALVIALHKFEDDHGYHSEAAWPPRKDPTEWDLADAEDT